MPTPKKGARLGGSPAHQKLILSNLATALFEHGRITTTEAKARALRPVAERLITKAKKAHLGENSLHNRRLVLRTIRDKSVVHSLFTEIAPQFAERPGGYTRITKVGPRKGDNAPMAVIELVTEPYEPSVRPQRSSTAAPDLTTAKPAEVNAEEPATGVPAAEDTGPDGITDGVDGGVEDGVDDGVDDGDNVEDAGPVGARIQEPAAVGAPAEVEAPTVGTDQLEVVEIDPAVEDVRAAPAQTPDPSAPSAEQES